MIQLRVRDLYGCKPEIHDSLHVRYLRAPPPLNSDGRCRGEDEQRCLLLRCGVSVRVHGQSPGGENGAASQRDRHMETCSARYGQIIKTYAGWSYAPINDMPHLPLLGTTEGLELVCTIDINCVLLCLRTVACPVIVTGGLYEATLAPQGKGGSSMDVMSPAKLRVTGNGE